MVIQAPGGGGWKLADPVTPRAGGGPGSLLPFSIGLRQPGFMGGENRLPHVMGRPTKNLWFENCVQESPIHMAELWAGPHFPNRMSPTASNMGEATTAGSEAEGRRCGRLEVPPRPRGMEAGERHDQLSEGTLAHWPMSRARSVVRETQLNPKLFRGKKVEGRRYGLTS